MENKTFAIMLKMKSSSSEEEQLGLHLTLCIKFTHNSEEEKELKRRFNLFCKNNYLTQENTKCRITNESIFLGPNNDVPALKLGFIDQNTDDKVNILWTFFNDPQKHNSHLEKCYFHLTKKGNFERKLNDLIKFDEIVLKCVETKEKSSILLL